MSDPGFALRVLREREQRMQEQFNRENENMAMPYEQESHDMQYRCGREMGGVAYIPGAQAVLGRLSPNEPEYGGPLKVSHTSITITTGEPEHEIASITQVPEANGDYTTILSIGCQSHPLAWWRKNGRGLIEEQHLRQVKEKPPVIDTSKGINRILPPAIIALRQAAMTARYEADVAIEAATVGRLWSKLLLVIEYAEKLDEPKGF